jgi:hypothetical protein
LDALTMNDRDLIQIALTIGTLLLNAGICYGLVIGRGRRHEERADEQDDKIKAIEGKLDAHRAHVSDNHVTIREWDAAQKSFVAAQVEMQKDIKRLIEMVASISGASAQK